MKLKEVACSVLSCKFNKVRKCENTKSIEITDSGCSFLKTQATQKQQEAMKKRIMGTTEDLVSKFLYYDRKEDPDLNVENIYGAFRNGIVTIDEVVEHFREIMLKQDFEQEIY